MNKILLSSLAALSFVSNLNAEMVEFDVSLKTGLTSIDNEDGWNFKKGTLAADFTYDLGYAIKPRVDLVYINIDEDKDEGGVSSLFQIALDGQYELALSDRYYVDPYVFAGLGYEKVNSSREGFDDKFFSQIGAGIKYPVTDVINLVTEFKAIQVFDTGKDDENNEFAILFGLNIPFHTQEFVPDSDKDGVLNAEDLCPNTPLGVKVDSNGCKIKPQLQKPKQKPKKIHLLDTDNDGVTDDIDECPNTPYKFKVDKAGCGIQKTLEVNFESNKATLTKYSMSKIKEFAEYMKSLPNVSVTIEGYTDSSGDEKKNMILSQKRAESVKRALVKEGIASSRITAVGKGSLNPIADNLTVQGRAKNRRIEAIIHH